MTVENYHLKWDAHLSHLNTSIATLYRNDKFADVMLYSSSPECDFPRIGILAHKFILCCSSQFFASIFDSTLPATTSSGVFHIVLPPDLTQRTIQILVQYMYSGEATVPNDILGEVLRGGELLKIRGLCRPSSNNMELSNENQTSYATSTGVIESNNCTRFANELRGLGASVLPEKSPVIVKSPKPPPQQGLLRISNCNTIVGGITVNKEVAIDPDPDEGKYSYHENSTFRPQIVRGTCRESGCTGCPDSMDRECPPEVAHSPEPKLTMRSDLHHNSQSIEEIPQVTHQASYRRISLPIDSTISKSITQPSQGDDKINCFQIKEEPSDSWHSDQPPSSDAATRVVIPKIILKLKGNRSTPPIPPPIKVEVPTSADEECSETPLNGTDRMPYTRLICDICKQLFDDPKAWVRHIETHHVDKPEAEKDLDTTTSGAFSQPSSKVTYVPKKRRRISPLPKPDAHVTLICDLCTMSFNTPAEWVRHINSQHTESELAMFNSQSTAVQQKPETELIRYSRRHHSSGLFKSQSFTS